MLRDLHLSQFMVEFITSEVLSMGSHMTLSYLSSASLRVSPPGPSPAHCCSSAYWSLIVTD